MKSKLVDPVHFFDDHGEAILNHRHTKERLRAAEAKNVKLVRMVKAMARRAQLTDQPEKPILH